MVAHIAAQSVDPIRGLTDTCTRPSSRGNTLCAATFVSHRTRPVQSATVHLTSREPIGVPALSTMGIRTMGSAPTGTSARDPLTVKLAWLSN